MGCCGSSNSFITNSMNNQNNGGIDYQKCLEMLTEKEDPKEFLQTLCGAVGINLNNSTEGNGDGQQAQGPAIQCVVVPVLDLCQEINLFDLNKDLLDKLIKCTFSSMFQRLGPELYKQVYTQYNDFFTTGESLDFATFSRIFESQLRRLYKIYRSFDCKPIKFYKYLLSNEELEGLRYHKNNLEKSFLPIIVFTTKKKFLEELAEEFTKTEFALCQKFIRLELDLVILMTRIVELTTNNRGGISGITEALIRIAVGRGNRYFEEDDFEDVFDAAEEVADVLNDLAKLYQERFEVFKELSSDLLCSRPQPPVKQVIREIPTIPPTVVF